MIMRCTETILLVEDDVSLRDSLCQFLHEHGYSTAAAGSVSDGWEALQTCRPRLCLLDLNLPDGSGLDLLRRLVEKRMEVRVIVMTAFDLEYLRPKNAGAVLAGWLVKPVNPAELMEIVQREIGADDPQNRGT